MRIRPVLAAMLAVAVLALVATGCQQRQQQRATEQQEKTKVNVQTALGSLDAALASAGALSAQSSKADIQTTKEDIERAWKDVKSTIGQLSDANRNLLEQSQQTFQKTIDGIPADATLSQRVQTWETAAKTFGESVRKVMQTFQPSTATTATPGSKPTP